MEIHLDFYLILLGIVFSTAWLLVMKGSKCWQVTWEKHIDMLENSISGPLHKIIYCNPKKPYYSVSKISEFTAAVSIGVWVLLFIQHKSIQAIIRFICGKFWGCIPLAEIVSVLLMVFCLWWLFKKCRSFDGRYRNEKGFIDISGKYKQ